MEKEENDSAQSPPIPEGPTDSHVLSQIELDEKGLSQKAGDSAEITDLGWTKPLEHIEGPLIAGIPNEDLWMLIRRFDKHVYNVKAVPDAPPQNLDLTRADDDEFTPDKLRATLERFYTSVFVALASFVKHVARLRSWKETRRTAIFCSVYFLAWLLDVIAPVFFAVVIALVIYPPCRAILFPPAPIALVDKGTGGVQKPKAGVLGSEDSITGAPERFKGEAAEQEASNLVASVASVAVGSAVGKHDQEVAEGAPSEENIPDASDVVANAADAKSASVGEVPAESHDKTRQPMKESVMEAADMGMQLISNVTDTFEKLAKYIIDPALSATPPFHPWVPRLRLLSVLLPVCLASNSVTSYALAKGFGFFAGFAFFGDPVIMRSLAFLNQNYPGWHKLLHFENFLLRGVPTNAQLTLTLLRIGEANAAPLPPPSTSLEKPPSRPASLNYDELELGASGLIGFFRGSTATGVEGKRGVDRMRATIGSRHAKNKIGVLRSKGKSTSTIGPVKFDARYKGKRGVAIIDSMSEPPVLYFTTESPPDDDLRLQNRKKGSVLFQIPVSDIQHLKKLGGLGWKGKLVVGWAMGNKEVVDGLRIVGKDPTQSFQLTAMGARNQLFNRLIAMDGQVWVSY
ncbi:hypothetical protein N7450_004651 [Penicillium hetheringtonii]|uniref:Uncharacterized protein n=1 Tax=Penicillium hetheringtonii TaxID=911720 RepID=A0AAD6DRW0_9EURO|nr:hypothetical protein N7450_004651 [Penicillium hetheringtonii]